MVMFVPGWLIWAGLDSLCVCDCSVLHQDTCCKKYICLCVWCMHIRHRNGNGKGVRRSTIIT